MKEKLKIGHPGGMDCVFHRAGRPTPVPSPGATGQAPVRSSGPTGKQEAQEYKMGLRDVHK